jgi:uncharacterized membrane protein YdbT with pleckstrin-like domain
MIHSKPDGYEGQNFDPKIRAQYANEPELTHATRAYEPEVPEVGEKLRKKHEESVQLYPFLNLSEGEFVMLRIRRHPIGLLIPVFITVLTVTILSVIMFLVPDFYASSQSQSSISLPAPEIVIGVLLLLILLSVIVGGIAVWIYIKNQFFLTNESVIQEIQHSLFSHHEQTVSLGSVEDASYKQQGILQYIFNYGTMRLSTEGEETTYRFAFVENPKEQIATVTDAVESFKNGRPVGTEFLDS